MKLLTYISSESNGELYKKIASEKNFKRLQHARFAGNEYAAFLFDSRGADFIRENISPASGDRIFSVGSDGSQYRITAEGVSFEGKARGSMFKWLLVLWPQTLNLRLCARIRRRESKLFNSTRGHAVLEGRPPVLFPSFQKYLFKDEAAGHFRHFRLHTPKAEGSAAKKYPLVIYLHGAGLLMGCNNLNHMFEYHELKSALRERKKSCHILCPQLAPDEAYASEAHIEYLSSLISWLKSAGGLDENRVYLVGTSRGGHGVLRQVIMRPELFAAAISCAGFMNMNSAEEKDDENYRRLAKVPLWLEHSSDDDNVPVAESDQIYEKVKSLGGGINYTRDGKGKHNARKKFYKNGEWVKWLFEQSRIYRCTSL